MIISQPLTNLKQLTPEWLTKQLGKNGHLLDGEVATISVAPLQKHHLSLGLTYSAQKSETLPHKMILKWYAPEYPHGINEGWFYQQIAPEMDTAQVPQCYDVGMDEETGQTHILLTDLSDTHFMPVAPFDQLPQTSFKSVVEAYGQFHAFWWEDAQIFQDDFLKAKGFGVSHAATSASVIQENDHYFRHQVWSQWVEQHGGQLSRDQRMVCEKALSSWAALFSQRIRDNKGLTLIQGDAHLNNVLLPKHPMMQPVLIDWEGWTRGIGIWDFTRMLMMCQLPADKRRSLEIELLSHYHTQLMALGVENYSLQNCHHDYRLCILANIPHALAWEDFSYLETTIQAFKDWQCDVLLNE